MQVVLLGFFCCISSLSYGWFFSAPAEKQFVLFLEAGGDAAHPGRNINDSFESVITYEMAQAIKQALLGVPNVKVILNRSMHDSVAYLQNANFANKLAVDCYISLHAYHETETKPRAYIYTFSYHDDFRVKNIGLSFYPLDKIYKVNQPTTYAYARQIKRSLEHTTAWTINGVYELPHAPLIGVAAPALAIEVGLKNKDEWKVFIDTLVPALCQMMAGPFR